ncbi:MAG: nucleotide sugar dehydrogenase, partial [Bdellovibrionales bacterium]
MGGLIGFAGLSHLGIVSSIATAAKGFSVVGFDPRQDLIKNLQGKNLPVHEPDLDDLLTIHSSRMRFTAASSELKSCSVVVVAIDIPTNSENQSDLAALDRLVDSILPDLAEGATLVILSQVRPGYTRNLSKRLGQDLRENNVHLYYQVETLVFGRAVERALYPERFIIGCPNPQQALPSAFENLLQAFGCPILPMRYESAELAKIAINIFLTSSVTATNTLAEICEGIGADWSEIVPSLQLDKRIGKHAYLSPGLGIAGGNLERDLVTIKGLAAEHGADDRLIDAFRGNSTYRRDWVLRTLLPNLPAVGKPVVAVWGLAYKQNTNSIKNSPSLALVECLRGLKVRAYDPQVKIDHLAQVDFHQCETALQACGGA